MKKLIALTLALTFMVGLTGANTVSAATQGSIIHTTDTHGNITALLQTASAVSNNDIWVDTGDTFHGELSALVTQGQSVVDVFNGMSTKPVAMTIGNHDLDYGIDNLKKLENNSSVPFISANITVNGKSQFKPYVIVNNIGIIGLTTPDTANLIYAPALGNVKFSSINSAMDKVLPELEKKKLDKIVVAGHINATEANSLKKRYGKRVSIILFGHDHKESKSTGMSNPGYKGSIFNKISLESGKVDSFTTNGLKLSSQSKSLIDKYNSEAKTNVKFKEIKMKTDVNADAYAYHNNLKWQDIIKLNYDGNRLNQKYQFLKKGQTYKIPVY